MPIPLKCSILALSLALLTSSRLAAVDPYEHYIQTSPEFTPVKQDPAWARKAFPSWTYMPWTYQWNIGYTPESGEWSRAHGYNGAFVDRGGIKAEGTPRGRLDWIDQFKLRFYQDHTGGKGWLHLWDGGDLKPHLADLHGTGVRTKPLNATTEKAVEDEMRRNIAAVQSSPYRAAYALDDEASWGHFVHPTMWQVTDDPAAFPAWLAQVYGKPAATPRPWISYEQFRGNLEKASLGELDASALLDQWTFNDAQWTTLLAKLVQLSNSLDPATPVGLVGGQMPSPFGGYDYARLMRSVQFLESYNIGSSQAIIRSFNPHNGLPMITTHFHKSVDDTLWQTWYYLAHGNRGHIGWVEGWFDGKTPKPWHDQVAPSYLEAGQKIGPLMDGTEWLQDGVAIYYSHPSIQMGWVLDAQCHGKTWVNRNADERLSSAVHVRHAWENMLRDSGVQYNYLSYIDVIQGGIPAQYKVLILPACLCLSDAEARRITAFVQRGGTVIADYLPGAWDQHGKFRGTGGGALDGLFGVKTDSKWKPADLFQGGKLWVEVDQDANYSWKTYEEFLTKGNTCLKDASGFDKAVRNQSVEHVATSGTGKAILMNLSPQWYNAYRTQGAAAAAPKREVFMKYVTAAGVRPWVRLKNAGEAEHGYEITAWRKPDATARTLVFVTMNPEVSGNSLGGGNSIGLKSATIPVTVAFAGKVSNVRNERTGENLGDGQEFPVKWKQSEAVVLSFGPNQPNTAGR